jgi:hypothetical protein
VAHSGIQRRIGAAVCTATTPTAPSGATAHPQPAEPRVQRERGGRHITETRRGEHDDPEPVPLSQGCGYPAAVLEIGQQRVRSIAEAAPGFRHPPVGSVLAYRGRQSGEVGTFVEHVQ